MGLFEQDQPRHSEQLAQHQVQRGVAIVGHTSTQVKWPQGSIRAYEQAAGRNQRIEGHIVEVVPGSTDFQRTARVQGDGERRRGIVQAVQVDQFSEGDVLSRNLTDLVTRQIQEATEQK